jgi:thiamine kinase-like enzyme
MFTDIMKTVGEAYRLNQDQYERAGLSVDRIRSGMNNALYRVTAGSRRYACKLCVADERRRAPREFAALQLLAGRGADIAPHPVGIDENACLSPFPALIYDWLDGTPLNRSADADQLAGLADALHRLHAVQPAGRAVGPDAWFHWFALDPYLAELAGFLDSYHDWIIDRLPGGADLYTRLARLVDACMRSVRSRQVDISREGVPLRFCHVDPNPANLIWGRDGRMRWVDWEYSGWGDPALDLAEYRWHERWDGQTEAQNLWLRRRYAAPPGDDAFWERVALWDCLLATRWPFLTLRWMWSIQHGPERLRLTLQDVRQSELRVRLDRLIQRAEQVNCC